MDPKMKKPISMFIQSFFRAVVHRFKKFGYQKKNWQKKLKQGKEKTSSFE